MGLERHCGWRALEGMGMAEMIRRAALPLTWLLSKPLLSQSTASSLASTP